LRCNAFASDCYCICFWCSCLFYIFPVHLEITTKFTIYDFQESDFQIISIWSLEL
jgi:hypothetical protein